MYGFPYAADSTIGTADKDHNHWSKEFECKLPYAIKLDGTSGVYIHEDVTSGDLSHGNTHGCINLEADDAKWLYNWVQGRTRVLIRRPW